MRFARLLLLLAATAACSSKPDEPTREAPPASPNAPASSNAPDVPAPAPASPEATPTPEAPYATLTAQWSRLRTQPNCFYFSGPEGRDNRLVGPVTVERAGTAVTLHIGGATFTGTYERGELALTRRSRHDHGGAWTVVETIRGRYLEHIMRARYHYEECPVGGPCPSRCTLHADLTFVR